MTGFTADYIVQQMADFKSGVRKDAARMNGIAKAVSDEESRQAAEWFAALKPAVWTKVIEADTVPKTVVAQGRMRFAQPGGGTEPIGNRIITVPQDEARARSRDPRSGFIAYVPPGSIAKGKTWWRAAVSSLRALRSSVTVFCIPWQGERHRRAPAGIARRMNLTAVRDHEAPGNRQTQP